MKTVGATLLLTVIVVACGQAVTTEPPGPTPIPLLTQARVDPSSPAPCRAALIQGVLVVDETTGVALDDPAGFVRPILWPHGYSGRPGTPIEVVDDAGTAIAKVGDLVRIGGGETGPNGAWLACGGVTVVG